MILPIRRRLRSSYGRVMTPTSKPLPNDIAALKAMVAARDQVIEALKLTIAKLQQSEPLW